MEGEAVKNKEHPLAGVVLCFTSILPEQRSKLAEVASQMGAAHKYDLTSDVTHLLVGDTNTEKYKFVARERSDVLVLLPEWIEAVRQSWMEGGDTDLTALEEKYKLPTFYGISICVTGFDDASYRAYLQQTAIANGADFRKDLTKNVTHLVAHQPSGQKYKFATQWQIKVVSSKWFSDSLERGMILDESRYDVLLPPKEQGVGAWNRAQAQPSTKRSKSRDSLNSRSRKLRRVASSKLGDQNEGIWGDIIGGGFSSSDKKSSSSSNVCNPSTDSGKEEPTQLLKYFQSTAGSPKKGCLEEDTSAEPKGFLQARYFYMHGFSSKQIDILQHHLTVNGANIVYHLNDFSNHNIPKNGDCLYIISSYKIPRPEVPSTEDKGFSCELVTDMWLERCLDAKALVSPQAHIASTPFPRIPIKGFEGMRICSTGFAGIDLLHISKMVVVLGANYDEYFTPNVSVLMCNNPQTVNPEKLRHALEWGIPVVSADWLWISVQSGQKKVFEPYLVQKSVQRKKDSVGHEHHAKVQEVTDLTHVHEPPSKNSKGDGCTQPRQPSLASTLQDNSAASNKETSTGKSSDDDAANTSLSSHSHQPTQLSNITVSKTANPTPVEHKASASQSRKNFGSLESAMDGFLKQARQLTRTRSIFGENGSRRRRPNLGRTNSLSSTKNDAKRAGSRASSIDTMNEDGYGSAVSVDTDAKNTLAGGLSRNYTGQSLSSLLNGSKYAKYVDSPIPETEEQIGDESGTPAMTQLNYDDPDALAVREEIMRLARRGNADESYISEELKQKKSAPYPQMVVDELPQIVDKLGTRASTRRTRRSAGKQQEEEEGW